jgi:glycosyltransferase involved in cell wall biosynthesis
MVAIISLIIDGSKIRSGGGLEHAFQFYKKLRSHSNKNFLFFASQELLSYLEFHFGEDSRVVLINGKGVSGTIWQLFILRYILKKNKNPLLVTLDAASACFYKKNIVIHQDMLAFSFKYWVFQGDLKNQIRNLIVLILQMIAIKRAKHVIFQSYYAQSLISKYIKTPVSSVVPHAVTNFDFDTNIEGCKDKVGNCINLLCVSPIYRYKDYPVVLKSLVELVNSNIKFNLKIIGNFSDCKEVKNLKKFIKENNLEKSVELLGGVSHKEVMLTMRNSDLLIFSSRCETFGITLLEAIESRLPIVSCDYPVYREIITKGGVFFPIGDYKSLAFLIKGLSSNSVKFDYIRHEQHKNINNFNWDKSMKKVMNIIFNERQ